MDGADVFGEFFKEEIGRDGHVRAWGTGLSAPGALQPQQSLPVYRLQDGEVAVSEQPLRPGQVQHFRFLVQRAGADLEIELKKVFGGAPALVVAHGRPAQISSETGAESLAINAYLPKKQHKSDPCLLFGLSTVRGKLRLQPATMPRRTRGGRTLCWARGRHLDHRYYPVAAGQARRVLHYRGQ